MAFSLGHEYGAAMVMVQDTAHWLASLRSVAPAEFSASPMAAPPRALCPFRVGAWAPLVGLLGIRLTRTWKLIRSQCSWPEERRTALLVYRSPLSSRWARGVYRFSSMVALYLMPRGRREQDHEGRATFPPKTVASLLKYSLAS